MKTLALALASLTALLVMTLSASIATAQDSNGETTALRVVINAQRVAAPHYANVPLLRDNLADVELLTDDDQAHVPLLRDRKLAVVARLR